MRPEGIMYYSKMFSAKPTYVCSLRFHQGLRHDFPESHNGASSAVSWQCSVQPLGLKNHAHCLFRKYISKGLTREKHM